MATTGGPSSVRSRPSRCGFNFFSLLLLRSARHTGAHGLTLPTPAHEAQPHPIRDADGEETPRLRLDLTEKTLVTLLQTLRGSGPRLEARSLQKPSVQRALIFISASGGYRGESSKKEGHGDSNLNLRSIRHAPLVSHVGVISGPRRKKKPQ